VKATGKVSDNTAVEDLTAPFNAPSLTLAVNGVAGESGADRLSNVQAVQALNPDTQAWEEVAYSAVSGEVPGVLTITPPVGGGTTTTFRVYYLPRESGWMTLPPGWKSRP